MKHLIIHKTFVLATARLSGYLVFVLLINLKLYAQNAGENTMNELASKARQEYKSFLQNKETGNYKQALEHLQNYANFNDSATKLRRLEQLAEINSLYESDKKAHALNLLVQDNKLKDLRINQNRFLIFGISGITLLVWLIVIMVIRQGRFRARQRAIAMEQSLLRSQMNSHFIFNTLTNIQSFVLRNDVQRSLTYLDHFSGLIGTILESSGKKEITLATEISTLSNYFNLQQLRFGNKLGFTINVDERLDPSTVKLPPMMIQPLIENAIDHGIKPKEGPGRVDVRFKKLETGLLIEVDDDGVGRNYAKENAGGGDSRHAGLALVILKERLESMNKGRSKNNLLEIVDLINEQNKPNGTLVRLELAL